MNCNEYSRTTRNTTIAPCLQNVNYKMWIVFHVNCTRVLRTSVLVFQADKWQKMNPVQLPVTRYKYLHLGLFRSVVCFDLHGTQSILALYHVLRCQCYNHLLQVEYSMEVRKRKSAALLSCRAWILTVAFSDRPYDVEVPLLVFKESIALFWRSKSVLLPSKYWEPTNRTRDRKGGIAALCICILLLPQTPISPLFLPLCAPYSHLAL